MVKQEQPPALFLIQALALDIRPVLELEREQQVLSQVRVRFLEKSSMLLEP